MHFARTASLCVLIAGASATWAASQAHAQVPVFQSDIERQEREREAQREARRKNYGPVVYPKFMDGGEKPNIAPEKPPVVYLEKNEPPGTIIVDTGGRKLYYVLPGERGIRLPDFRRTGRFHLDGNRADQPYRVLALLDAAA